MQRKRDRDNLNDLINISKKILKILYVILIVVGAYLLLKIFKELGILNIILGILKILTPLFIGIVVAWLLNPLITRFEKKKIRRGIGVAFAYIILIGCIVLLVKAIIPLIYNQTIDLVANFPDIFSSIKDWLFGLFDKLDSSVINLETIEKTLSTRIDSFAGDLSTSLPSIIINSLSIIVSSIGTFIIGLVIGFFLLLSCKNLSNTLLEMVPKKFRSGVNDLAQRIDHSLRGYVNGALFDAFIVFVISSTVFAIMGLKAPLLFGLFCGLTNVIPYAGPYIGGAPAVIVAFSQNTGLGIAILIAIFIIQAIEGNVLQTLIISKTTKLNPVTIIIGLLIFGHFFGIVGMLLSTPIIGVCKVIFKYFDEKYNLTKFE